MPFLEKLNYPSVPAVVGAVTGIPFSADMVEYYQSKKEIDCSIAEEGKFGRGKER